MKYQLIFKEYISYSQDVNKDKSKEIIQNTGFNTSSMLVINHLVQKTVKTVKEEPKYTTITFISDVGGILGIFLGFSLWSIHSAIIAPFVKKLESKISDHMMQNDSNETIVGY